MLVDLMAGMAECCECASGPEETLVLCFNDEDQEGGNKYQLRLMCVECLVKSQCTTETHVITTTHVRGNY